MTEKSNSKSYRERMWPSPGFFLATLLIVPAITVLFMPFAVSGTIFIGFAIYLVIILIFMATSKKLSVENGEFDAGRAHIEATKLGKIQILDSVEYRQEIGRKLDARAFLVMSGWLKTGIKVEILDEADPTPYWIVSSRKPAQLKAALINAGAKES